MEYQVNQSKLIWKINLLGYLSNMLQDIIWAHIPLTKFPLFAKSHYPFDGGNLKVDTITDIKLNIPFSMISIGPLMTLGLLQPISNKLDFLNGLINYFRIIGEISSNSNHPTSDLHLLP